VPTVYDIGHATVQFAKVLGTEVASVRLGVAILAAG
jgi:hypothetical protein